MATFTKPPFFNESFCQTELSVNLVVNGHLDAKWVYKN